MMRPWRTRSRRTLLDRRPWIAVESHEVELPDGRVVEDWPWLVGREFVNVVPVTDDETFVVFRQVKYAVEGTSLAPVGGYVDEGEDPATAARRELLEEAGYEAGELTPLGRYVVDGNRGAGVGHLFLATGARRVAEPDADDLVTGSERATLVLPGAAESLNVAAAGAIALYEASRRGGS